MLTMATNLFCESMGQRVTCMGASFQPKVYLSTSIQRHRTEERSTLYT